MSYIKIRGARVNNLKSVDLDIPLNKLTCFFGVSGSGKSSIAFHTLYSESKRRFLNSFPTYLKFFSDRPAPVDVDEITPVLPVFGLPQTNPVVGTRSNVADIMHLTQILQSIYYNYSEQLCSIHKTPFIEETVKDVILSHCEGAKENDVFTVLIKSEDFVEFFKDSPFPSRSLKTFKSKKINDFDQEDEYWEVVRFKYKNPSKLNEKLKQYLDKGIKLYLFGTKCNEVVFKKGQRSCAEVGCTIEPLQNKSVMHFSPYNALGACSECNGFGETLDYDLDKLVDKEKSVNDGGVLLLNYKRFGDQLQMLKRTLKKNKISLSEPIKNLSDDFWEILYSGSDYYEGFTAYFNYFEKKRYKMNVRIFIRNLQKGMKCKVCHGSRLDPKMQQFFLDSELNVNLIDIFYMNISETLVYFKNAKANLLTSSKDNLKAITNVISILQSAVDIGLGHLDLNRKAKSLSAGEYQRLLLLKYLSYEGTGSLFVFDEPSLGLSDIEKKGLLKGFKKLIDQKNTVVIVDHSKFFRNKSDYVVEMGPKAGALGGEVLFEGSYKDYKKIKLKNELTPFDIDKKTKWISVEKPEIYSKRFDDFKLPLNHVTWVTGSSGSGKSACLVNILANQLNYIQTGEYLDLAKGSFKQIKNSDYDFEKIIIVDANLNRYTSRSTVGSMTELFGVVRKHFTKTPMAKAMNLVDGHFSYYSEVGQCPKCEGKGVEVVEMQFLEDIVLTCEDCKGKRLKPLYADFSDGLMTVHEAFSSPLSEVLSQIKLTPKFQRVYEYLKILNLDYLSLNRSINSLSGGEKQRIYLLNKLIKDVSNSILFFENISFGLSDHELLRVSGFLQQLSLKNNTIVIIDQDQSFSSIASHTINFG